MQPTTLPPLRYATLAQREHIARLCRSLYLTEAEKKRLLSQISRYSDVEAEQAATAAAMLIAHREQAEFAQFRTVGEVFFIHPLAA